MMQDNKTDIQDLTTDMQDNITDFKDHTTDIKDYTTDTQDHTTDIQDKRIVRLDNGTDSTILLIWRVIYPYIIYLVITVVIQIAMMIPEAIRIISSSVSDYNLVYDELMNMIYEKAMLFSLISGILTIPVLFLLYKHDKKLLRDRHLVIRYAHLPLYYYGLAAILGVFACLSLNNLIDLLGVVNFSPVFQELQDRVFGGDLLMTFLTSAIMAPILEELLFRGLIYKRLRVMCKPMIAAVISSLVFGITHGNLVQFIYAFIAGLLLAFVYEKFKNIWAPILFHFCANSVSLLGVDLVDGNYIIFIKLILFLVETAALLGIYQLIKSKVNRKIVPINSN